MRIALRRIFVVSLISAMCLGSIIVILQIIGIVTLTGGLVDWPTQMLKYPAVGLAALAGLSAFLHGYLPKESEATATQEGTR